MVSTRRVSLFTTRSLEDCTGGIDMLGGRIIELQTKSGLFGTLDCLLLEPLPKRLDPQGYMTTGVVICIHGMPPSPDTLEEWLELTNQCGWLTMGMSVAVPNVQMSSALQLQDFEAIIDCVCEIVGFDRCILVGKAWGAQRVVEIAAEGDLLGEVQGVVLAAPSSPPPAACRGLHVPAFVLWARDDSVSPFDDAEEWIEALDNRSAPTTFRDVDTGGHRLDLMAASDVAQLISHFTVSSLLIAHLEEGAALGLQGLEAGENEEDDEFACRSRRLTAELPGFAMRACHEPDEDQENAEPVVGEPCAAAPLSKAKHQARRQSHGLQMWIQSGLPSEAE